MPYRSQSSAQVRSQAAGFAWAFLAAAGLFAVCIQAPVPADDSLATVGGSMAVNGASGSFRCLDCHQIDAVFSHPVGIAPSMHVPAHLPLDNGRVSCLTCHDATAEGHADPARARGPMLRQAAAGASLCAQCHDPLDRTGPGAHAAGLVRAHLHWPGKAPAGLAGARSALDVESTACMSCHDGTIAADAGAWILRPRPGAMPMQDHPVGVVYGRVRPASSEFGPLVDASRLDHRIRLFDGVVGCGSCHSVYSPREHLLVKSNLRSDLCLSCHVY